MVVVGLPKIHQMMRLLLQLWTIPPSRASSSSMPPAPAEPSVFPSLEDGLVLFRLLRYILVSRAVKLGTPAQTTRGGTNTVEWVRLLALECSVAFDGKDEYRHPSNPYMALFAAGGLL